MSDNELLLAISEMMDKKLAPINDRLKKIELTQENEILPRLQNIEACYTSTYKRYSNSVEDYENMKQDIAIIKKVIAEHSEKLKKSHKTIKTGGAKSFYYGLRRFFISICLHPAHIPLSRRADIPLRHKFY